MTNGVHDIWDASIGWIQSAVIGLTARSHFWRDKKMSFRKMFKSKGPEIDPYGTRASTFPHSLKELFILQRWSLFVR